VKLYFDTAYVAKCYVNEAGSADVRALAYSATELHSSAWCIPEVACVFQRHIREHKMPISDAAQARELFLKGIEDGLWTLFPIHNGFLYRVESIINSLPGSLYLRAGDAIHLAAAREGGIAEIWSNDRRLLQAAPAFGLAGKSV
jgi:predicted nucleic acid-binding protein